MRVTGFLESFDLDKIIDALEFTNKKLYKYKCDNLSENAILGFTNWATELTSGNNGNDYSEPVNDDDYGMEWKF